MGVRWKYIVRNTLLVPCYIRVRFNMEDDHLKINSRRNYNNKVEAVNNNVKVQLNNKTRN